MAKRIYNVFFHTHTISGIIISALLYVIFFTGSISFLRDEINAWQRNQPIQEDYFNHIDFDTALHKIEQEKELYGRDISFSHRYFERMVGTSMTASKDTTIVDKEKGRFANFFYMDMNTFEKENYFSNYSLGEFFYRLHFFAQLNFFGTSGYALAGLVAFFFLFAVITGVIVHWKKIIPSFYLFRPKAKWKTIWTDAHVALGLIGLPYQFMFAVTGCYLIIGYMLMLAPVQSFLFNDNPQQFQEALQADTTQNFEFEGKKLSTIPSINDLVEQTLEDWPNTVINQLKIINYGDKGMHVKITCSPGYHKDLLYNHYRTYRVTDQAIVAQKNTTAEVSSYTEGATQIMRRLHYGDFGGYGLKLIYLCLGFITCFVILSGVHIWLVARDKKSVSPSKRRFNKWLVLLYTAVCLSILPATAISFSATKILGIYGVTGKDIIYHVFFWPWLLLTILFLIKQNNFFTNKMSLLLGGIFSLSVPISNGIATGNWWWIAVKKGYDQLFVIDLFWLLVSITCFAVLVKLKKPKDVSQHIKKGNKISS